MKAAILVMMICILTLIPYVSAYPYSNSEQEVSQALEWLRSQQQANGSIGGFATSSWAVMAIVASGEDPHNWSNGGDSIIDYLKKNTDSLSSPTDYSRFILSMVAAGEDPRNVNGTDLVATLESFYNGTQFGDPSLINDDFWAVMTLTSAGIDKNDEKIQSSIAFIKTNQNEGDHGWSYGVGADSDVDSTAAAIMALISADESQSSTHITNGLEYMKSKQISSGGFDSGWGNSAESDSWAIQAIVAAGQDPTGANWTKEGKNPIDDLLSFQNQDGSFNDYNPAPNSWTTSYAIPALLGKPYPILMEMSAPTPPPQSGCLIVTATLGTEMAPEVIFMRHVRDDMIGSNEVGRILVVGWNEFYYSWSPTIAETISSSEILRSASSVFLVPLIAITHITAIVYSTVSLLNPVVSSVIAFLSAAVLSITIYMMMPFFVIHKIYNRIKK